MAKDTVTFTQRSTGKRGVPISKDLILQLAQADNMDGICVGCGAEAHPVEPDARMRKCEACGENRVYGAEELLFKITF